MFKYIVKQDNKLISQGIVHANSKDEVISYLTGKFGDNCTIKVTVVQ